MYYLGRRVLELASVRLRVYMGPGFRAELWFLWQRDELLFGSCSLGVGMGPLHL